LCTFFLGLWLCFGPKSIDSSFLSSVVIVVVVAVLIVSISLFKAFFFDWNVSADGILIVVAFWISGDVFGLETSI
jgi:hypothetical protein